LKQSSNGYLVGLQGQQEEMMAINNEEENKETVSKKAGKLTKKLVKLTGKGVSAAKQVPGKTVKVTKNGVESFKQGYNS